MAVVFVCVLVNEMWFVSGEVLCVVALAAVSL